jgi:adenosylhomocysteine nucleosidase
MAGAAGTMRIAYIWDRMKERIIGIMGAMPEEIDSIIHLLSEKREVTIGMRTYSVGEIEGIRAVVVFSRWGKVAAASTVSTLILEFKITELIFTGVAGAISHRLAIGDIVLGQRLVQHDMDARPFMQQFEIPLLGGIFFEAPAEQLAVATQAINHLLDNHHLPAAIGTEALDQFGISTPKLFIGDIASGDQFFSNSQDKEDLLAAIPSVLCVEMEGAAVAQVCFEYSIPFSIIRTISDAADEKSHVDFPSFIKEISSKYSLEIVKSIFSL